MSQYGKEALSFDQQLELLASRGLRISDPARALHWLQRVSYYRLSAYLLPFKVGDRFREGVDFDDVAGLYAFDRELRLLVMDAMERIEVALRTGVTYAIAHHFGPFGHVEAQHFSPRFDHARLLREIREEERRGSETFVAHFRQKYHAEPDLPVWMATELLSFGSLSRLFLALPPPLRQEIAASFEVDAHLLCNLFHSLTYVRNVCAHHRRLWNRELAIRPKLPRHWPRDWPDVPTNERIYAVLVAMRHLMRRVAPRSRWSQRVRRQFDAYPRVPLAAMGCPSDAFAHPFWR